MRITFLCPHVRIAGGVRAILAYADRLAARGHDTTLVVPARNRVDAAWRNATFADLELPHVDGPYPRGYRFAKRINSLVLKASMSDHIVREQVGHVRSLQAHPDSLARPGILTRVLWRSMITATR